MAIDKVKDYFGKYNMSERIQEFEVSSATVELEKYSGFTEWINVCKGW